MPCCFSVIEKISLSGERNLQANFDLEEFIAYLLNGSLLLIAVNQYIPLSGILFSIEIFKADSLPQNVVNTLVFAAAAILGGHISSIISRYIIRHLIWRFVERPRNLPFTSEGSNFWTQNLRETIQRKTNQVFNELDVELNSRSSPRLIRSYVLCHSREISEIRVRIVRARSLCANAVFPLLLFSGGLIWAQSYLLGAVLAVCALLLALKQHDLDTREWKEIYLGFLAL